MQQKRICGALFFALQSRPRDVCARRRGDLEKMWVKSGKESNLDSFTIYYLSHIKR